MDVDAWEPVPNLGGISYPTPMLITLPLETIVQIFEALEDHRDLLRLARVRPYIEWLYYQHF